MLPRVKKTKKSAGPVFRVLNHRGQAVIEYVLILVITVSLVLALVSQIFKPFQEFIQSYMGEYVACLLETGELPSLGGDDTTVSDMGCDAQFAKASFSQGRPPLPSQGNSGGGAGSSSPSGGTGTESESSERGGGSSSGSSYAGSSSRNGSQFFRRMNQRAPGADASGKNGKVTEIPVNPGNGFFKGSGNRTVVINQGRKVTSVDMSSLSEEERKRLKKEGEELKKQTLEADEGYAPKPKKMLVKPPPERSLAAEEDEPFTIGNFIRYLIIAGIIIALVIFLGGQALQMSKSMEK